MPSFAGSSHRVLRVSPGTQLDRPVTASPVGHSPLHQIQVKRHIDLMSNLMNPTKERNASG